VLWTEWNGKYRDTVRAFWKGDPCGIGEFASRLTGSSDLYQHDGRHPSASINFVTAHDGFTLADLVSYDTKHNEANGEQNHDGERNNVSWNHGVEGPTDDPSILEARRRQVRTFLATLIFSQGVPMLSHGDELGRTQRGNNNAYCHDSPLTWIDWELDEPRQALLDFARRVLEIRREQPVLRRRHFFQGRRIRGSHAKDLTWLQPNGDEMIGDDWRRPGVRVLGLMMAGDLINDLDDDGNRIVGDTLLLLLNGGPDPLDFQTPPYGPGPARWELLLDTARPDAALDPSSQGAADAAAMLPVAGPPVTTGGRPYHLAGRSLALLRLLEEA
jgi:glycogen operon protein